MLVAEFLLLVVEYLDVLGGLGLLVLVGYFGCLVLFQVLWLSVGIDLVSFGSPSFRMCVRGNFAAVRGCLDAAAFKERKSIFRGLL